MAEPKEEASSLGLPAACLKKRGTLADYTSTELQELRTTVRRRVDQRGVDASNRGVKQHRTPCRQLWLGQTQCSYKLPHFPLVGHAALNSPKCSRHSHLLLGLALPHAGGALDTADAPNYHICSGTLVVGTNLYTTMDR